MNALILIALFSPNTPVPPVRTQEVKQTTYLMTWGLETWQMELRKDNFYICRKIKNSDGTEYNAIYSTHGRWEWDQKKRVFRMTERTASSSTTWEIPLDKELRGTVENIYIDGDKKNDPNGITVVLKKGKYKDYDD